MADASSFAVNRANGTAFNAPATVSAPTSTAVQQQNTGGGFVPRNPITGAADYTNVDNSGIPKAAPAVFSSGAATAKVNNTLIPAMNTGQVGIAGQNAKNAIDPNYQMSAAEMANPSLYTARIKAYNATKNGTTTPTPPAPVSAGDQAMKDAANTPDPGFQFVYDASGNKQQIAQGAPVPPGLSTNPPANPTLNGHTVVRSTTDANGTQYQQYSDGSYGLADQNGQFAATATEQDFNNADENNPSTVIQHISAALASLSAGAVPLTEPQQAQVNALQTQLAQNVAIQTMANSNFTGATTVAENLYGMGNSIAGIGIIKGTIDAGVAKIQSLQSDAAVAIAKMTDDFQQENYKDMLDSYNAQLAATTAIQTHIENMQKFAETQKVDTQNQIHQNFQDLISSDNFELTKTQDAINNAFQQQQITETQRHNLQTEAVDRANAMKGVYTQTSTGQILDTRTGKVIATATANAATDPSVVGHTGNAIVDANTKHSPDGIPYVDGTNLSGAAEQNAQLIAAQNGIPYLGKEAATGLGQATAVKASLDTLQKQLDKVDSKTYLNRPFTSAANAAGGLTQYNATVSALGSYSAVAIPLLKALSGNATGFRITQTELNLAQDKYLPKPNDTVEVVQNKINNINQILSNGELGVFGSETYNQFKPDQSNPLNLSGGSTGSATTSANNQLGI